MTIEKMLDRYDELVEVARKLPEMTEDEKNEQRASWAYGQMALTRAYHNATPEELCALRVMCRKAAGCKPLRRDRPERAALIKALTDALDRCPDLRLGQAIVDATSLIGQAAGMNYGAASIEDDELTKGLERLGKAPTKGD